MYGKKRLDGNADAHEDGDGDGSGSAAARAAGRERVHRSRNRLDVVDARGEVHAVLVESTRHVTRTWRGAVVQTGGDRFFLAATRQPLVLDPDTAVLRTEDGSREFAFRIG